MEIQSGLHKELIDYQKKKKKSLYGMVWGLSGKALLVSSSKSFTRYVMQGQKVFHRVG